MFFDAIFKEKYSGAKGSVSVQDFNHLNKNMKHDIQDKTWIA